MVDTGLLVWQTSTVPQFHVGDVIRKLRQEKGWTIEDLSQRTSVNKGTISGLERGEGNPRLDTLLKLAEALDVAPERLFPGIEELETVDGVELETDAGLSAEAASLARTFDSLRDINSRRLLQEMAERFRAAEPQQPPAAGSSPGSAAANQETADEGSPRIRKTRGA